MANDFRTTTIAVDKTKRPIHKAEEPKGVDIDRYWNKVYTLSKLMDGRRPERFTDRQVQSLMIRVEDRFEGCCRTRFEIVEDDDVYYFYTRNRITVSKMERLHDFIEGWCYAIIDALPEHPTCYNDCPIPIERRDCGSCSETR